VRVPHRKTSVVIYFAVIVPLLPLAAYFQPFLIEDLGMSLFWSFFWVVALVVTLKNYIFIPLFSIWARPFLQPWPTRAFDLFLQVRRDWQLQPRPSPTLWDFSCLMWMPQYEPIKSVNLGLPCLRAKESVVMRRLRELQSEVSYLRTAMGELDNTAHAQVEAKAARPLMTALKA
jgi:hypothetical protein